MTEIQGSAPPVLIVDDMKMPRIPCDDPQTSAATDRIGIYGVMLYSARLLRPESRIDIGLREMDGSTEVRAEDELVTGLRDIRLVDVTRLWAIRRSHPARAEKELTRNDKRMGRNGRSWSSNHMAGSAASRERGQGAPAGAQRRGSRRPDRGCTNSWALTEPCGLQVIRRHPLPSTGPRRAVQQFRSRRRVGEPYLSRMQTEDWTSSAV